MRRLLREGDDVEIAWLSAREPGTVEAVEDGGRTVVVVSESGEVTRFRLIASGHFVTPDRSCRLVLVDRS